MGLLAQCVAITRKGQRCSTSTVKCADGTMAGAPLSNGCNRCMFHLELICLKPVSVREPVLIYLDFETSGLSVTGDFIVEVGLLDHANHAVFSSVVCPSVFGEGPNVHGIEDSELKEGHWLRFSLRFFNVCVALSTTSSNSLSRMTKIPLRMNCLHRC